jgi:hypothetical protein
MEGARWWDDEGGWWNAWEGGRSSASAGSPAAEPAAATAAGKGGGPLLPPGREEQGAVALFQIVRNEPLPIFKLEFFENFRANWNGNYKQHNAALKWFRDEYEDRENPFGSRTPVFGGTAVAEEISKILKYRAKGKAQDNRDWDWDHTVKVPWSWLEMVAQMDGPTMLRVVCGPDNDRSRGLVRCECRPCPSSLDNMRHTKGVDRGQAQRIPLPQWDFVLIRDDGSGIRVHPSWSSPKFNTYEVEPHSHPVRGPRAGLGKSDGHGTFTFWKMLHAHPNPGRFDASKGAHLQPRWSAQP